MTDLHTHILPGMDDGAQTPEESLEMIRNEVKQGIRGIALTPHLYPDTESLQSFHRRRSRAVETLREALGPQYGEDVTFYLGAEVYWFDGIQNAENLKSLCIGKTGLLMLEMPMETWKPRTVEGMLDLASSPDLRVVIAHIERYAGFQRTRTLNELLDCGVMFQSNAAFFLDKKAGRTAIKMLKDGQIHFLGSDAHNMTSRPPQVSRAIDVISGSLGESALRRLEEYRERYGLR